MKSSKANIDFGQINSDWSRHKKLSKNLRILPEKNRSPIKQRNIRLAPEAEILSDFRRSMRESTFSKKGEYYSTIDP